MTRPGHEVLAYDFDGNLTSDAQWTYEWDAENRLKRMVRNSTGASWGAPNRELIFTYDFLGRRIRKVVYENGATTSDRKFLYDGWNLIAEIDSATGKLVRSYAWGLDLASSLSATGGVGALVLQTIHTDTTLTSYHVAYDGGGNVTALVNRLPGAADDGKVAAAYEYGPFGETVRAVVDPSLSAAIKAALTAQPFRFSTKFTDVETGLVYYGLRYYDPSLGRFINRDPIGEAGGSNLYGFVGNGPVNRQDVLGAWWKDSDGIWHPSNHRRGDADGTEADGASDDDFDIPATASQRVGLAPWVILGVPTYVAATRDAATRGLEENRRAPNNADTTDAWYNRAGRYGGGLLIGVMEGVSGTVVTDPSSREEMNGRQGGRMLVFGLGTYLQIQGGVDFGSGAIIAGGSLTLEVGPGGVATIVAGPGMAIGGVQMAKGAAEGAIGTLLAKNAAAVLKMDMNGPPGGASANKSAKPSLEKTPTTNPDQFGPVKGKKGKVNNQTGEIWEKDMFHKDHYEVYKNKKDYDNGVRSRSVWEDGRPR